MNKLGTGFAVLLYFARRGRWEYLIPVSLILLVGLLIVVALASPASPLIYPFV